MESTSICKHCGERAVKWDENCGTGCQKMCVSCGVVYSETKLVSNDSEGTSYTEFKKSNTLPDAFFQSHYDKIPEGLKVGREKIRCVCSSMALKSHQEGALMLYEQMFYKKEYIKASIDTKTVLAVWCVYIECRKAGLPITMQYMANMTGSDVHKLFRIHKEGKALLSLNLPHQDITELIEIVLANEIKANTTYNNSTKELTKELIMLCKQLWLVEGRHTHIILLAAFFIAWQAENFTERKKSTIADICRNKSYLKTCLKRIGEFRKVLCELVKQIPWVESEVKKSNVGYYVKDVVRYQRSLILDVKSKIEQEAHAVSSASANVLTSDSSSITGDNSSSGGTENIDNESIENCSTSKHYEKRKQDIESDCLLMPPSFKRARRKSVETEEILDYIQEGRKLIVDLVDKMNNTVDNQDNNGCK